MDVVVLLSTYDGEPWLRRQLDSILDQEHRPRRLLIRDDGSHDGTLAIAREYERAHPGLIAVTAGDNLGPTASFLGLLRAAPAADAYAFADQDDVWHRDKLRRAVERLRPAGDAPRLCCGRLHLIGADGGHLGWWPVPRRIGFGNALVQNVVTGCTAVLNAAAARLITRGTPDRDLVIHDWWMYLVVSAFGTIDYDPRPAIDYRLHPGNAIGLGSGRARRWARRLALLRRRRWQGVAHARALLEIFGDELPRERARLCRRFVRAFADLDGRWPLALDRRIRRQHPLDDLAMRALILAGARI